MSYQLYVALCAMFCLSVCLPSTVLDSIWVMVIVWRLRGNTCIIRTALCWIVWYSVHSQQHTYMSSSYRSNRLSLSHWDPYAVCRGGCLELYYCNMVKWFWWDLSLISTTSWFPSVLWHCWFGHLACKNHPWNDLQCVKPLHYYYYFLCVTNFYKQNISTTNWWICAKIFTYYHGSD